MEKAGLVDHDKEGVTHRYRPTVSRQQGTGSLLSDFLARFFHGSAEQLVLGLVDADELAADDLRAIEARLAGAGAGAGWSRGLAGGRRRDQEHRGEEEEGAMTVLVDHFVVPWLSLLTDWSIRWGAVLAVLATWFLIRPPRRAVTRYVLCLAALAAGGQAPERILSAPTHLHPVSLPFFDHRTVAVRISRLLEDDMLNSLSRVSAGRSLVLGILAAVAALGVGGLRVRAVEPQAKKDAPATAQSAPAAATGRTVTGVILDPDGKPVAGAVVVAGIEYTGKPNHRVFKTDDAGRFTWSIPEGPVSIYFVAYKEGFAPAFWREWMGGKLREGPIERKLAKPEAFEAILVDGAGKPVEGAKIQVDMIAQGSETKDGPTTQVSIGYNHIPREVLERSPIEGLFVTTSGANGSFVFRSLVGHASALKLMVTGGDGRALLVKPQTRAVERLHKTFEDQGFITTPLTDNTRLVAVPAARVAGRVVTKLPGVGVGGLTASFQDSHQPGKYRPMTNFGGPGHDRLGRSVRVRRAS